MILILEKYIAKTLFFSTALCSVILLGVMLLIDLLTEFKNVGEGDYGMVQAIIFVLMRLPVELYQFTPILILLGSILGLSVLSASREMAVMRVSGFSVRSIMKSVLMAVVLLLVVLGWMGEYLGPKMSYTAEIHKEYAKNAGQAVMTTSGIWLHVDNNFIHVENVVNKNFLENVTRYQFDHQHRLLAAYFGKRLVNENNHWVMYDVVKTTFSFERTKSEALGKIDWDLNFNNNLISSGDRDPSDMSLPKLVSYARFLEENGLQANGYRYELWQRLLQPLAALIMVFF